MYNFLLATENASNIGQLLLLIGVVIVMFVLMSVSQRKRVKAYEEMKERLRAGDRVQTTGGIVGKINKIKETNGVKTVFIETGDKSAKVVIEFDINAIAGVVEGVHNPNADAPQVTEVEDTTEPEAVDVSFDEPVVEIENAEEAKKEKSKNKKK